MIHNNTTLKSEQHVQGSKSRLKPQNSKNGIKALKSVYEKLRISTSMHYAEHSRSSNPQKIRFSIWKNKTISMQM